MVSVDAILLAGGRASRVGGAAKPLFEVGGRTLLHAGVDAVRSAGARRIVVVGPVLDADLDVRWVREDPPFGGPVAAIVAALDHVDADEVLVLACDLPTAGPAVALLPPHLPEGTDGACLDDGRRQWLIGRYRTAALRAAASGLPERGRDASMRALLGGMTVAAVSADAALTRDIDTWDDLTRARGGIMTESRTLPPEALNEWSAALAQRFGLAEGDIPISLILDLARDVANGVARPAAPLSAFVAGLAAGRAGGSPADTEAAVAAVVEMARGWEQR
ncbi:NTP transferase domain-containing protein [Microbacterium sp. PRF11]|uniref:NTP transferase domain-containing protein n=1 Tax=Microbacterium sp. PRF11 TaxID=2962593 RepID=UPI002881D159|nr:NTP transferase domain-containing protein [Microbacterium sp. PRF11]MDT0116698.1 NTP transferase domain-containing protein [Microbacterium sp. PRF11]